MRVCKFEKKAHRDRRTNNSKEQPTQTMAWVSASTAIYLHCCLLFTAAFYLAKDAQRVSDSVLLMVICQAMRLDHGALGAHADATAVLVVLLSVVGLTDVVQLVVDNTLYFESMVPSRLTLAFLMACWGYMFEGSMLHDDVVFALLFVEVWFHFVVYNIVRQEKHERNKRLEEEMPTESH